MSRTDTGTIMKREDIEREMQKRVRLIEHELHRARADSVPASPEADDDVGYDAPPFPRLKEAQYLPGRVPEPDEIRVAVNFLGYWVEKSWRLIPGRNVYISVNLKQSGDAVADLDDAVDIVDTPGTESLPEGGGNYIQFPLCYVPDPGPVKNYTHNWAEEDEEDIIRRFAPITIPDEPLGTVKLYDYPASGALPMGWKIDDALTDKLIMGRDNNHGFAEGVYVQLFGVADPEADQELASAVFIKRVALVEGSP